MIKRRVLIVDDDPSLSRLAGVILEQSKGYEVRIENHPTRALAAARQYKPDLILLDVDMPGKSGGEVAREIRSDRLLCDTPILFLTALASREEAGTHEVERGGSHFLAKPVDSWVLLESVERMLQH